MARFPFSVPYSVPYSLKLALSFALCAVAFVYLSLRVLLDEEIGWGLRYMQYKTYVSNQITTPKILFTGGSSTLFGIRTDAMQDALKRPSVNLGVSGGFSLAFLDDQLQELTKAGDIAILIPDYEAYGDGTAVAPGIEKYDFQYNRVYRPERLKKMRYAQMVDFLAATNIKDSLMYTLIFGIRDLVRSAGSKPTDLNATGDYELCHDTFSGTVGMTGFPEFTEISATWLMIRDLHSYLKSKGAELIVSFPPRAMRDEYLQPQFREKSTRFADFFRNRGVRVVGDPLTFSYDRSQFCNTFTHLNKPGAYMHTAKFIKLMQEQNIIKM